MKKYIILIFLLQIMNLFGQAPVFYKWPYFNGAVSSTGFGMMGVINPANAYFVGEGEMRMYSARLIDSKDKYSGYVSGMKGFSFSVFQEETGNLRVNDYTASFAFGTETLAIGTLYGWSSGDRAVFNRKTFAGTGVIWRPAKYVSLGGVYNVISNGYFQSFVLDGGVRPFGNDKLTLFAGTDFTEKDKPGDFNWTYGVEVQLFSGLGIVAQVNKDHGFNVGFKIGFGVFSVNGFSNMDNKSNVRYSSSVLRIGGMEKSVFYESAMKNKTVKMELQGKVVYKKYQLLDAGNHRFFEILQNIENCADDNSVEIIAVNISGLTLSAENGWEIRRALENASAKGKKVVIYLDRGDMTLYHLASVADLLVLDPEGLLMLKGYAITKTYLKGTLEKMGLAFDEWRFFKYKSAAETLSRTSMSDADREQLQKLLDDIYLTVKNDIIKERSLADSVFDNIVNNDVYLIAEEAKDRGLVDVLGRWKDIDKIIEEYLAAKVHSIPQKLVNDYAAVDDNWGEEPQIAVLYALGVCDMDKGINARKLEKQIKKIADNKQIKALVLRVDSPGGDALASDLVAEAIKDCKEKKPVVISQGSVAASGGYWISMYGDEIVASPLTITGSIGVIGGWLYDVGLASKLGMTSDMVKVGEHAGIDSGVSYPLLGSVPARNLTPSERKRMETLILGMYDKFVAKVAAGRNLSEDHVRLHAQGRVYSGIDGYNAKLTDRQGGLKEAILSAADKAGLKGKKYEVKEYDKYIGLFPLPGGNLGLLSVEQQLKTLDPVTYYYLTYSLHNPFIPLPMLNPELTKIQ